MRSPRPRVVQEPAFFEKRDCSFKKALEALQVSEAAQEQLKEISDEVQLKKSSRNKKPKSYYPTCKYCSRKHELDRTRCPAYGKTCRQCGKVNHFHTVCLQRKRGAKPISIVQELPDEASESDEELFAIVEVGTLKHDRKGQFFVPLCFMHKQGSSIIECQLDTGATCNAMSMADLCTVLHTQNPPLKPEISQLNAMTIL